MSVISNFLSQPAEVPRQSSGTAALLCSQPNRNPTESILTAEICDAESADRYADLWQALSDDPLERNVFYEPWMLLPALQLLTHERDVRVMFVFRNSEKTELVGVFPLEYHHYKFLPLRVISLWRHPHCFLCTPLLKADSADQTIEFVLDRIFQEYRNPALIVLRTISGDGPFQWLLANEVSRHKLLWLSEIHSRPIARRAPGNQNFLAVQISGKRRRALLRRERRLAELGELTYQTEVGDLEAWISSFLEMEGAGWKGREGTALSSSPAIQVFFRRIVTEAQRRGKLIPLSLLLDGRPLAHRLSFVSGDEAFAFKSTYDESHAPYSPGTLLEIENLRYLQTRPDLRFMDSCTASPEHSPLNGMWKEQRAIHTMFLVSDTSTGRFLYSALPRLRAMEQRIRQF